MISTASSTPSAPGCPSDDVLARALWPQRAERARAIALAEQARDDPHVDPTLRPAIDAWLTEHQVATKG